MHKHGWYMRTFCETMVVERVKCSNCSKTFSLLVCSFVAFKHYKLEVIEQAIRERIAGRSYAQTERELGVCRATIRSWCNEFAQMLTVVLIALGYETTPSQPRRAYRAMQQRTKQERWRLALKRRPLRIGDLRRKGDHLSKMG